VDERLFARLAARVPREPIVLASVVDTRGATPRKSGSRMLIGVADAEFSIGGGAAEARVLHAARQLLANPHAPTAVDIDLSGRAGASGVCGGRMRLVLRRWHGGEDAARAQALAAGLARGRRVALPATELGDADAAAQTLHPDPRLLLVGAGHCGLALYEVARLLDFELWVFDEREACFAPGQFAHATRRCGDYAQLTDAFDTEREVYAVLLNRDFPSDVATLRVLAGRPLAFLGMMGSRKRIGEVLTAVPEHADALHALQAPIGLEIGAHTPHEIAISILAQLIQVRSRA
jgi:xanthine dehydrogenase accessory factor